MGCMLAYFGLTLVSSKVIKGMSSLTTDFYVYAEYSYSAVRGQLDITIAI